MHTNAEQDYLLAIYQIQKNKGVARTIDLAKVLGIKSPSVTDMLGKLCNKDLILYKKYEGARLTQSGLKIAKSQLSSQLAFKKFLKRILVPGHLIEKDAHLLEHGLSPSTMRQFEKFVKFMDLFGENPCFFAHFKLYCQKGKLTAESKNLRIICPSPKPK